MLTSAKRPDHTSNRRQISVPNYGIPLGKRKTWEAALSIARKHVEKLDHCKVVDDSRVRLNDFVDLMTTFVYEVYLMVLKTSA